MEIKFRGQRVDTREWVYGFYAERFNNDHIIYVNEIYNGDHFLAAYSVIPETVGQYTGLKDKTGKAIYEGDIVKAEDGEIFTVKYGEHNTSEWNDTYELGFYVESNNEEEISRAIRTDIIFWVKYRGLEVIGDIYTTPELLEVSE